MDTLCFRLVQKKEEKKSQICSSSPILQTSSAIVTRFLSLNPELLTWINHYFQEQSTEQNNLIKWQQSLGWYDTLDKQVHIKFKQNL